MKVPTDVCVVDTWSGELRFCIDIFIETGAREEYQ